MELMACGVSFDLYVVEKAVIVVGISYEDKMIAQLFKVTLLSMPFLLGMIVQIMLCMIQLWSLLLLKSIIAHAFRPKVEE